MGEWWGSCGFPEVLPAGVVFDRREDEWMNNSCVSGGGRRRPRLCNSDAADHRAAPIFLPVSSCETSRCRRVEGTRPKRHECIPVSHAGSAGHGGEAERHGLVAEVCCIVFRVVKTLKCSLDLGARPVLSCAVCRMYCTRSQVTRLLLAAGQLARGRVYLSPAQGSRQSRRTHPPRSHSAGAARCRSRACSGLLKVELQMSG